MFVSPNQMVPLLPSVSKHFGLQFESGNPLDSVYFDFKSIIPPHAFTRSIDLSWDSVKQVILNFAKLHNILAPEFNDCMVITLPQLLELKQWENLYYTVGKNFFLFIFLECKVFFKWSKNTFILMSDFDNSIEPKIQKYSYFKGYKDPLIAYETGFNVNSSLNMHKMLYNIRLKKTSAHLNPQKSLDKLKSNIYDQPVGFGIHINRYFDKKEIRTLKKILSLNPTLKECEKIFNSIADRKNIYQVHEVASFVLKVIKKHIPNNIFGYKKFFCIFLRNIQQLLTFNMKQTVTLGFLMKGINLKSDIRKKNILAKTAMWILNIFVIKLLSNLFYVSEVAKGNSLIFIRKHFWLKYQGQALQEMVSNKQLVEVEEIKDATMLKQLRFLPKLSGSGYRLLIRKSVYDKKMHADLEVCNVFLKQLLATKYGKVPNPCNDIHRAWTQFSKMNKINIASYYVKTDIMDAYGSVIHEKLKSILDDLFENLPDHLKLVNFKFIGKWGREETLIHFIDLDPAVRNKIITYKYGGDKIVPLIKLRRIIFEYIDNAYISQGPRKKNYRLASGLLQGGKLSAVLCELYYSALDNEYMSSFRTSNGDILLRAVDDYVLISQNLDKIKKFLEIMLNGFPEYGVKIQIEKTVCNYDSGLLSVESITKSPEVDFFGFLLDVEKNVIRPNMEKYKELNMRSCITFKNLTKSVMENKMTFVTSLKLQPLLLDSSYQTKRVMYTNIHLAACVLALKFEAVAHFFKIAQVNVDESYLKYCVIKGVNRISSTCHKKGKPVIQFNEAKKISLGAFINVLRRKKCFKGLVYFLKAKEQKVKLSSKKNIKIIKSISKIIHPCLKASLNIS